jgi:hypothetical protein
VKAFGDPGRYFLHAAELRLRHPAHHEVMEFHSPLPSELQNLLTRIRLGKGIL